MKQPAEPAGRQPSAPTHEWVLELVLARLVRSRFRAKFHLRGDDLQYYRQRDRDTILAHARQFIGERLGPAVPARDGKQTPWRGHPVFVAQHATATCCRGCLARWHKIEKGRQLETPEIDYSAELILAWLERESAAAAISAEQTARLTRIRGPHKQQSQQMRLFEDEA